MLDLAYYCIVTTLFLLAVCNQCSLVFILHTLDSCFIHQIFSNNLISIIAHTGKGKYTYSGTGDIYQGEYFKGKRQGKGIYSFANGSVYEGEFKDNVKSGLGTYRYVACLLLFCFMLAAVVRCCSVLGCV